jgi:hypothetical protein|tara:strand:- start:10078 stop:10419 length:342 start_codon:yes stop_codon:yes gene_type:complete
MSECITLDLGDELKDSKSIVDWFTNYGWSYDSETGKMLQGEEQFYINIYQKIGAIYFKESGMDFPDDVFGFIVENPSKTISLVSVDDSEYVDMSTAQEFTYDKFVEMIRKEDE